MNGLFEKTMPLLTTFASIVSVMFTYYSIFYVSKDLTLNDKVRFDISVF